MGRDLLFCFRERVGYFFSSWVGALCSFCCCSTSLGCLVGVISACQVLLLLTRFVVFGYFRVGTISANCVSRDSATGISKKMV